MRPSEPRILGPLDLRVRNMKKLLTILLFSTLVSTGCMSVTRWPKFSAANVSTEDFFGSLRLVRISPTTGTIGIEGYMHEIRTSLRKANGFHLKVVQRNNRSHHPTLKNIKAEFGPIDHSPSQLRIIGANDIHGILLLFDEEIPLNDGDIYRLRIEFTNDDKHYIFTSVGPITENVEREFYLLPLPNSGFSRAMN